MIYRTEKPLPVFRKYLLHVTIWLSFAALVSCGDQSQKQAAEAVAANSEGADVKNCQRLHAAGMYDSLLTASRKALVRVTQNNNKQQMAIFNYYMGIGLAARQQRDSSIYRFRRAEDLSIRLKNTSLLVNTQVQLAALYYDFGRPDSVRVYKNKLTAEFDTVRDIGLKMKLEDKLADIYAKSNQPARAIEAYFKVLSYGKSIRDSTLTGDELRDIASVYAEINDFDKAVTYTEKAISYFNNSPHRLIVANNDLGTYYVDLQQYEKAIKAFDITIGLAGKYKDTAYKEATFVSIASPLIELKEYKKATNYLNQAFAYYNGTRYELGLMYATMMMGKIEKKKGDAEKALVFFNNALAAAKKTGHQDTENYIYSMLAQTMGNAGHFKEAYAYELAFEKLRDEIMQAATKRNIADLEIKYQSTQKDEEIKLLNEKTQFKDIQINDQRRERWFLVVIVVFLVILAFVLLRSYTQKRHSNRLLQEKNEALSLLNGQLNEANSSKTKLFSILSHDLRTPVSSLFQFLTIQRDHSNKLSNEQSRQNNERIIKSAANLLDSMEDLLIWSKSQMEAFTPDISKVDACDLIDRTINLHKQFAEERNILLERDCIPGIAVYTDINFFSVILRNLVSNAIKFTPAEGRITISAGKQAAQVYFKVVDTGPGLTEEQLAHIFEWNSIRSSKSGFGLKLAKEFIIQLGGEIHVNTILGHGTAFTVYLPEFTNPAAKCSGK